MSLLTSLLKRPDIWKRLLVERLTEPIHLNLISLVVAAVGSLRAKILFDVLPRQNHAYALLHAADMASARGLRGVTVIELGVGSGTGLLNMCELATRVTRLTGIEFKMVGFDTGHGMPPPKDYRDHPELYKEGWFPMGDPDALRARLPSNARLVIGNLSETVPEFAQQMDSEYPLAFVSLDVDFYSSSTHALRLFQGAPAAYLPYVTVYVDDMALPTNSRFAGELLAIREFNATSELRKMEFDSNLIHRRVFKHAEWLSHMFKLHVFDHPERNDLAKPDSIGKLHNPYL